MKFIISLILPILFYSFISIADNENLCVEGKTSLFPHKAKMDSTFKVTVFEVVDSVLKFKAEFRTYNYKFCAEINKEYIVRHQCANYITKEYRLIT